MSHNHALPMPPVDASTVPIHCPDDLRQRWRARVPRGRFGERTLWVGFVGPDRRLYKTMSPVPIGYQPSPDVVEFVISRLPQVLAGLGEGHTVALLLTTPGIGAISERDRHWSTLLTRRAAEFDVPLEPIFRANDKALVLVEPED